MWYILAVISARVFIYSDVFCNFLFNYLADFFQIQMYIQINCCNSSLQLLEIAICNLKFNYKGQVLC